MAEDRIATLIAAESRLNRSFWAAVVTVLGSLCWMLFVTGPTVDAGSSAATAANVLLVLQLGAYIWYAVAAGGAARVLGDPGWKYIAWILAAPLLARLPIPIVSTIIGVSPLSIKFLLGGQLQTAIRQEGFAGIHEST